MDTNVNTYFIQASRLKLRFQTNKGEVPTEDLWKFPLVSKEGAHPLSSLNDIAIDVDSKINKNGKSFVAQQTNADATEVLKLEIVKAIIEIRQIEERERLNAASIQHQKTMITNMIANKQVEELSQKSPEELKEILAKLG